MVDWSLVCEYLALIILTLITSMFYQRETVMTRKRKMFLACLVSSMACILINVATYYSLNAFDAFPLWFHYFINSLYFISSVLMASIITYYILCRVYEFFYDKHELKFLLALLIGINTIFLCVVILNIPTGILFYFDNGTYVRGSLNILGYVVVALFCIILLACYWFNRKSVSANVRRIMIVSPAIVIFLIPFQVMFPDQLLNGIIAAIVCLIIFLNFQNVSVENDSLTTLGNRSKCIAELYLRTRSKQPFQIVLVALRNFSQINHIYGHRGGDKVLFYIAKELNSLFSEAHVFRFNSVEFLILMPACASFVHELRINDVKNCMDRKWPANTSHVKISYCLAEITDRRGLYSVEGIVERLDYEVALAKSEDLQVVRYNKEVEQRFNREQALELYMRKALNERAFEVWYQPIFYCESGKFESCEALVRLRDKDGNLISPAEFIPIAENNGLIDGITDFVLEETCKLLASDDLYGPRSISVNLTVRQILQYDLVDQISWLLDKYKIEPGSLKLEVTERILSENEDLVLSVMQELEKLGVHFLLDDFGTGYSNFATILNLSFECIKIDRSLVKNLPEAKSKHLLADALTPFFHDVGHKVLVEGIETKEQLDAVIDSSVDRIQGYYFAKPMPQMDLIDWYKGVVNSSKSGETLS